MTWAERNAAWWLNLQHLYDWFHSLKNNWDSGRWLWWNDNLEEVAGKTTMKTMGSLQVPIATDHLDRPPYKIGSGTLLVAFFRAQKAVKLVDPRPKPTSKLEVRQTCSTPQQLCVPPIGAPKFCRRCSCQVLDQTSKFEGIWNTVCPGLKAITSAYYLTSLSLTSNHCLTATRCY